MLNLNLGDITTMLALLNLNLEDTFTMPARLHKTLSSAGFVFHTTLSHRDSFCQQNGWLEAPASHCKTERGSRMDNTLFEILLHPDINMCRR